MERVTDTQLNRFDRDVEHAEKLHSSMVCIDTRFARDLLRELRRLRDREAATSGTEEK